MLNIVDKRFWQNLRVFFHFDDMGLPIDATLSESVQPVVDILEIMGEWSVKANAGEDLSVSTGTFVPYFTVPVDERWEVHMIYRGPTTAVTSTAIQDRSGTGGGQRITITDGSTSSEACYHYAMPIWLEAGDAIGHMGTANGGDSNRGMNIRCRVHKLSVS